MTAKPITTEEIAELRLRIDAAIATVTKGMAAMSIPANPRDVDLVLADCAKALDALEEARRVNQCSGCGGTVGDHLAPDQGGCPGSFMLDGVQMVPQSGRDLLGREREALAKAYRECIDERDAALARAEAAERERDEAVALIDAAKSDTRPESFLEHAQAILAKCVAPYSCEQMKAVGDALAACYRKWELMSEVAMKACEERDAAKEKSRRAAQTIIEAIGAVGSEDSDEAAVRIVANLEAAKAKLAALSDAVDFYQKCKADPQAGPTGAYRDAVEWIIETAIAAAKGGTNG